MSDTQIAPTDAAVHHLLEALDGHKEALGWLDEYRRGLALFIRALNNGRKAIDNLREMRPEEWDQLFEAICNDTLAQTLEERHPDVALLFEAVKGDNEALTQVSRKKPTHGKLATAIREFHERYLLGGDEQPTGSGIPTSAAADVGCLIGEMHLSKGEYHKAIEAFSRAIENQPTADAFEGRAKAYRALAALDEHRALEMIHV
jgi:tetratricopeptide (TPR) repeat protein